ncbi:MAG TPA: UDP-4-amino-4,6-dideoxy-N-acetyl-beta-L-altrosamine transaminase [Methanobacteriaceae archaeon]|nr:UDP-4-amino-4,6-dideoxy-N-acetyl-beta-L-altrosamine transaminase [Methanobacteriaceae archaeon]
MQGKRLIPYARQSIDDRDVEELVKVIRSDFITQGPKINEFEESLATYCGAEYAVTFNSGTSALHAAYHALGIGDGDEVITTPNTFVATSNAALYLGAKPVFTDLEMNTGNMDLSKVEMNITSKTKLIVPVHYGGYPLDLVTLHKIAQKYEVPLIEDAAHALGAKYRGERIGNCRFSAMTVFSFHPVKHITTGEGGAVLTNDPEYYENLLMFRTHGITKKNFVNHPHGDWYYEMQFLGYNYRMTDIQAVLGVTQLKKLDGFVKRRREIAALYDEAFRDNSYIQTVKEKKDSFSSYHLYPILLKNPYHTQKKEIFDNLRKEGLGVQIHYIPVYLQPYYQRLGYKNGSCPVAEDFYQREISIPLYPAMTNDDVDYVIKTIFEVFESIGVV